MFVDSGSYALELTAIVVSSFVSIGLNFHNIWANRKLAKDLKRDEAEELAKTEREQEYGEYKRLVNKHERMLTYLKGKGLFARSRFSQNDGNDFDFDA